MLDRNDLNRVKPSNLAKIVEKNLYKENKIRRGNLVINAGSEKESQPDEGLGKSLYALCVAEHYENSDTTVGIVSPDIRWIKQKMNPSKGKKPYKFTQKIGVENYFYQNLKHNYTQNKLDEINKAFKEIPAAHVKELWHQDDKETYQEDMEEDESFYTTKPLIKTEYVKKADLLFVEENPFRMLTGEIYYLYKLENRLKEFGFWDQLDKQTRKVLTNFTQKIEKNTRYYVRNTKKTKNSTFRGQWYDFRTDHGNVAGDHIIPFTNNSIPNIPRGNLFNRILLDLGEIQEGMPGKITTSIKAEVLSNKPDYDKIETLSKLKKSLNNLAKYQRGNGWQILLSYHRRSVSPDGNHPKGNEENVKGIIYQHYLNYLYSLNADVIINYAQATKEAVEQVLAEDDYEWFTIEPEADYKTVCHHIKTSLTKGRVLDDGKLRDQIVDKIKSVEGVLSYWLGEDDPKYVTYSELIPRLNQQQADKNQYFGNMRGKDLETDLSFVFGTPRPKQREIANECWNMFGKMPDEISKTSIDKEYIETTKIGTKPNIEGYPLPPSWEYSWEDNVNVTMSGYSGDIEPADIVYRQIVNMEKKDAYGRMRKQENERKHLVATGELFSREQFAEVVEYEDFADLWVSILDRIIRYRDSIPQELKDLPWHPQKMIDNHPRLYMKSGDLFIEDRPFEERVEEAFKESGVDKMKITELLEEVDISKPTWNKKKDRLNDLEYVIQDYENPTTIVKCERNFDHYFGIA